ncbi:MAG: Probable (3R)-hydroxyacyl-CoA dehydratase HtdX [uncultured Solirubrobacterales bacterium]|uniref:Probable (3R)-hydroxyacyl-CoA dehydratase HtdX n=1 Tax=uncultured Solirubrobacterales bacterium TaxID=768556 RepID=A0A6J4SBC7_9ACTN|nr:MAG: Probable (3R)-hydroxyacyl-CoA dehydratase HtdX [uncultured Solirubrobacterales bacterium]
MYRRYVSEAPGLGGSYARALRSALPIVSGGGTEAPDYELAVEGVHVDRDHLAAYDRVCGFRLSDELPATYVHVLAFPLALRLMTEREFPLPIVGLVHIENRVVQHRAVSASEELALRVRAERLRPHDKGTQIDLVGEAMVDDEVAWTGVSTYLRRGGGSDGNGFDDVAAPPSEGSPQAGLGEPPDERPAPPLHPSATVRVPDDIGRRYAAVAGDRNPIHLHSLSARLFGFPRAIAHGMWLKARALAMLEGRLDGPLDVQVRFKKPLLLPSKVTLSSGQEGDLVSIGVHSAKDGSPHLTGTVARR